MLRLILLALSVAAIAQIPAPNIVGGDVPSGASNLTTVGAIPYVSASGVLNQDTPALFWDAANDRLRVGGAAGAATTSILGSVSSIAGLWMGINTTTPSLSNYSLLYSNGVNINAATGDAINFRIGNTIFGTQLTNGNWIFGTGAPTDAGYKLDVAASGTAGTARVYDATATTGTTRMVVRAGAGQGATNLTEWQNANGVVTAYATSAGEFGQRQSSVDKWYLNYPSFYFANAGIFAWSSTTDAFGARDLGLYRNAAGVLEINNGTAGTYRDLILRRSQHNGVTVADLPTAAAGNAGSIQYVTDANATTIGSTVAGGGANKVMVWSDGAAWKIFAN